MTSTEKAQARQRLRHGTQVVQYSTKYQARTRRKRQANFDWREGAFWVVLISAFVVLGVTV